MSEEKSYSPNNILQTIRKGYEERMSIRVGEHELKVRIIPALEQCKILAKIDEKVNNLPHKSPSDRHDSTLRGVEYNIAILEAATTIGTAQTVKSDFWKSLPTHVLSQAYDRYSALLEDIDPEFEKMPMDKVLQIIDDVKKKKTMWSDYYTSDLALMGRFFLESLSHEAREPGS